jgi:hypothetical protein
MQGVPPNLISLHGEKQPIAANPFSARPLPHSIALLYFLVYAL